MDYDKIDLNKYKTYDQKFKNIIDFDVNQMKSLTKPYSGQKEHLPKCKTTYY